MDSNLVDRYDRQARFPPIGSGGQDRLRQARALLCGCGALGTVIANTLVRAGVGYLRIVDRDYLELNNLQRQVLFDERDVAAGLPKAIAAAQKLQQINSQVVVEPLVQDVDHTNIGTLCEGMDLILDGTDNFETRFLLNDAALFWRIPWIYGGCIGAEGQTMTIIPEQGACLRCIVPEPPPAGSMPTCDTAGILGPIVNVVASFQACEAIKILSGNISAVNRGYTVIEMWENRLRTLNIDGLPRDCPACAGREYPWLRGERGSHTAVLCGRNAVHVSSPDRHPISLQDLAHKLVGLGEIQLNDYLLRFHVEDLRITVFADGRAMIAGTDDVARAKTIYARYLGV